MGESSSDETRRCRPRLASLGAADYNPVSDCILSSFPSAADTLIDETDDAAKDWHMLVDHGANIVEVLVVEDSVGKADLRDAPGFRGRISARIQRVWPISGFTADMEFNILKLIDK
ncbi:MAG: hypothetical protein Q7V56_15060 [Gammaproteobacteria bacterium]|nr:hypothetical protein [Gammaproteobacteria bacterium]